MVGSGGLEIFLQDSANHVLVEVDAESMGNLFGDARAATPRIAPLKFEDGLNDFLTRTLRSRSAPRLGREEIPVFLPHQRRVDSQERRWTNTDGGPLDARALQQLAPEGEEQALDRREVRSPFSGSIEHQKLLLEED